jgi:hypothetical protein
MDPTIILIVIAGSALAFSAYFLVSTFRRVDPQSPGWQSTCTMSLLGFITLIAVAMVILVFAPWPYCMLALVPLVLNGLARNRFMRSAANRARVRHDAGIEPRA